MQAWCLRLPEEKAFDRFRNVLGGCLHEVQNQAEWQRMKV
jgi:hypothetical protein